jgi:LPXTG-site transpeptidase (sortase) family protein
MSTQRPRPRPMPTPQPPKRRRRVLASAPFVFIALAIVLAAAAGIVYVESPNWGKHNAQAGARNVGSVPTLHGKLVSFVSPNSIEIPKLSAKAPIVKVGTDNRDLDIPLNPKIVGWWDGGAHPGARKGTAILAGHINYSGVTGVLARIGSLNPGDRVYVTGTNHGKKMRLAFRITGVRTYKKTALPYKQIFDQKSIGRLAIVTCGGPFDSSTGNYEDNIVAFAVPA